MYVRLTSKLAEKMEGVDLSRYAEGEVVDLSEADALLLITGGWAERVAQEERVDRTPAWRAATAADQKS